MTENESINGWTFEETVKTAENLMEAESNMFKWDVLRHLRDFLENYKDELEQYRAIGTVEDFKNSKIIADERYDYLFDEMEVFKQYASIGTVDEFKALKEKSADIEKIIESINQLPTQDFMGVLHIPRTATINRIKRGGNCELPEV